MAGTLIGLDIGSGEVKFAVRKGSTVRFCSSPLPENMVANGRVQLAATMKSFLREEKRRWKIPGGSCCLILPDQQVFCRMLTMPYMPEKQLLLNLPYEFRDYIAQSNDKYYYDYALDRTSPGGNGEPVSLDLLAACAPQAVIREYAELLAGAGLRLTTAIPREMAYVSLLREYERENPGRNREYCFLDIGRESVRVHFYTGPRLAASRSLDLGCRDIDLAIAEQKNVDEYVAASYKLTNYENVLASNACREVYARIAVEVMKAVHFYRFRHADNHLEDIYFLGGGARIAALRAQIVDSVQLTAHDVTELLSVRTESDIAVQAALAFAATEGGGRT